MTNNQHWHTALRVERIDGTAESTPWTTTGSRDGALADMASAVNFAVKVGDYDRKVGEKLDGHRQAWVELSRTRDHVSLTVSAWGCYGDCLARGQHRFRAEPIGVQA